MRRASGIPIAKQRDERFDMLWFKAPTPPSMDDDCAYQFLQRGGTAFCHPHPDGLNQYGWAFPKGSYRDIRAGGPHAWADAITDHVPTVFADHLSDIREDIEVAFLNIVCFHLDRWSEPGLLLIGDAAHPMSAVGGQGINMAVRDAVVTANHLGPVLREGPVDAAQLDAAAEWVAIERLPELIRGIQARQQSTSRTLHLETLTSRLLIERLVPLLGHLAAPLVTRGVGASKPFRHGISHVDLTF
jgi:2-polyprenyl-6-methoxyphenol hydroxylase-like FAD-dependent oxidoreductase